MRSFINAQNVMNASDCQDRVIVAGMVELRQGGPRRPRLYGARPVATTTARLAAGKPVCSPERPATQAWRKRLGLARHCSNGRSVRHGAARIS